MTGTPAADAERAYAAWVLVFHSATRRTAAQIRQEARSMPEDTPLGRQKRTHALLNLRRLDDAVRKREKDATQTFLGRRTVPGVGPWGKQRT